MPRCGEFLTPWSMAAHGDRVPANVWQQDTTSGEWLLKIGKGSYKLSDPDPPPVPAAARWRKQRAHQRKVVFAQGGKGEPPAGSAKGQTGKTSGGDQSGKKGASGKAGGKGAASKGRQYDGGGPRPKGGTSYEPKPKKPWVVCQVPNCPGHNGLRSFKYVIDIGRGANGLCCLGCGVEWMWSLQHQLAHGGIPGLDPVEAPPRSASRTGAKQPSPFVDTDPIEIDESKPIFAKSAKDSPFGQRAVPADILAQCPPELRSLLEVHLLQGGAGQSTIDRFQEWAAEEDGEHARAFLAAAAAGQARLAQKVVPPPATATAPKPAGEVEARTPSQIRNSARATLNGARAEAQRQEKALEVSL